MKYEPLSAQEEHLATAIVESAYAVHGALGPGLLESVYEVCFCHELDKTQNTVQAASVRADCL